MVRCKAALAGGAAEPPGMPRTSAPSATPLGATISPSTQPRVRGFEKNRLEALIDGVFAVVLTLLVLDLKLPDDARFATNDDLWKYLHGLERHFVIYVISFVVVGMYWINHHIQFHFVLRTDRPLIWINLGYLLLVSFLPFATDLVGDHKNLMLPCEIYGVTLLALSATSFVHLSYLWRHRELASPELTPEARRAIVRRIGLFAVVPLISMVAASVSTHAAVYVYVSLVASHFLPGRVDSQIGMTREGTGASTPV
jgi:uncharacterized membrane protein